MSRIQLDIELLTEVSCSEEARSLGAGRAHDYIPGRMLWGVLATRLYARAPASAEALVFSGGCRVSDARPVIAGKRTVPVPKSWHKLKDAEGVDSFVDLARGGRPAESLAELSGVVTQDGETVAKPRRAISLRTAMQADGRALDAHLFAIEAMPAGTRLMAFIDITNADEQALVEQLVAGEAHIGRSRNAELGLVRITTKAVAPAPATAPGMETAPGLEDVRLLCVSRLVLRDDATGAPRLQPVGADFGLPEHFVLRADKTFIRTSRHSPFNSRHLRPKTERQCIEAGSVIVFAPRDGTAASAEVVRVATRHCAAGVGLHADQGFGEVWVNPPLLATVAPSVASPPKKAPHVPPDDALYRWALARTGKKSAEAGVRSWAEKLPKGGFQQTTTAQWGAIGDLARQAAGTGSFEGLKSAIAKHLSEGRSRELWGDFERKKSAAGLLVAAITGLDTTPWDASTRIEAVEHLANAVTRSLKQGGGTRHE